MSLVLCWLPAAVLHAIGTTTVFATLWLRHTNRLGGTLTLVAAGSAYTLSGLLSVALCTIQIPYAVWVCWALVLASNLLSLSAFPEARAWQNTYVLGLLVAPLGLGLGLSSLFQSIGQEPQVHTVAPTLLGMAAILPALFGGPVIALALTLRERTAGVAE